MASQILSIAPSLKVMIVEGGGCTMTRTLVLYQDAARRMQSRRSAPAFEPSLMARATSTGSAWGWRCAKCNGDLSAALALLTFFAR
jgi:accessory colonization factor AcfC